MYTTASGIQIPQGTDSFSPTAQFKDWADGEAEFDQVLNMNLDSERTALTAPKLRDGVFCWVRATKTLWRYEGTTWVILSGAFNLQTDGTNTKVPATTQYGFGKIGGSNTVANSEVVTFPAAFSGIPSVTASFIGQRAAGAFNLAGLGTASAIAVSAEQPSSTTVNIVFQAFAAMDASLDWYYTWQAIGVLA